MKVTLLVYLLSFICANLIVNYFGPYGLWFSSFFLIPFDFVIRCLIHERYKGLRLILTLSFLTLLAACATVLINFGALNIALGSIVGFAFAQLGAGLYYQTLKSKSFFIKVNGSDLVAIIIDSVFFQLVAFGSINFEITLGQILIKFAGGFLWYLIIFKWFKLYEKI